MNANKTSNIDGQAVHTVERLTHGFIQRGVGVDGAHHGLYRGLGFHGCDGFRNQFERFRSNDVDAQDLAEFFIRNYLYEALMRPRMLALLLAENGNFPAFTLKPCVRACASVRPTLPMPGSV